MHVLTVHSPLTTVHSFIYNTAINDGVVLAADSSIAMLSNSIFSDNVAGFNGGAVYLYDNSTTVINSCSFSNGMAGDSGGAVYGRKDSTISISNSMISTEISWTCGVGYLQNCGQKFSV